MDCPDLLDGDLRAMLGSTRIGAERTVALITELGPETGLRHLQAILDHAERLMILPGEMKDILNQVVQAEKAAQANIIKRREETAATRSLLNTARLMSDNPTLLRLKELEALEKVTEKVDKLTVFGGLDGVMQDVVKLSVKAE